MLNRLFRIGVLWFIILCLAAALTACGDESEENRQVKIGLVTNSEPGLNNVAGFIDGMAELGYVEGQNVTYIYAGAPVSGDALNTALQGMVEAEVDLIFTAGTPAGVAAHRETADTKIPVVFGVVTDPISAGIMDNLTTPGGNITGVTRSQSESRRLELLLEIVPEIERIFVPYNPNDTAPSSSLAQIEAVVPELNVTLVIAEAVDDDQVIDLLNNVPDDIDAIFLLPDTLVNAYMESFYALSIERGLPISGPTNIQVEQGALMAYGFIHYETGAQAASIADKILKGADPGTIPVETAESYLGINLKTAEAIGIDVPYNILQQAKFIIRPEAVRSE